MAKKILIVDDEPSILMSLDFLFRKKGYEVFIARDGREAIDLLNNHQPDLTILDIMMPEVDGYEVCAYIRKTQALSNSGIIFLSAKSKKSDMEKGLELGADAYITKPFSNKNLMENVQNIIQSKS
ncbi:MAG: response regulator [Flavobacteriales bacterium]|nr:MAG: response regulator [Flavobacteriales bacterium]